MVKIQQRFLKCIIAHKTLLFPNFRCENMAMWMPHFHRKYLAKFHVWCTMAHQQGFTSGYTAHIKMLVLWWAEALQNIRHVDACRIYVETNVTQVTWIKTITLQWLCTQYSTNMHLQQLPWAHTHTTWSRALVISEGHLRNHKSPSYKVHNHPHMNMHIYIYTHTYIMHNAIMQGRKVKQTLPTFQGYGPIRSRKSKKGTWRGGTLIQALEKRLREKEKEKTTFEGLGPLIYWTLPFMDLHALPCIIALFACT